MRMAQKIPAARRPGRAGTRPRRPPAGLCRRAAAGDAAVSRRRDRDRRPGEDPAPAAAGDTARGDRGPAAEGHGSAGTGEKGRIQECRESIMPCIRGRTDDHGESCGVPSDRLEKSTSRQHGRLFYGGEKKDGQYGSQTVGGRKILWIVWGRNRPRDRLRDPFRRNRARRRVAPPPLPRLRLQSVRSFSR